MPTPAKPSTLAQLIALAESDNNQYATRFEPSFRPNMLNVNRLLTLAKINKTTATILCSMSFGFYQIMGDELMSMGLQCSPIEYCATSALQDDFFNRYCSINRCAYTLDEIVNDETKRLDFAHKYNGPGNVQAYADRLMGFMQS